MLGKPPRMRRVADHVSPPLVPLDPTGLEVAEAARRVLLLPAVADKTFLVTIGDRSVTGLVARDQLVGRFQVPVADVAVTAASYDVVTGEAMAMGERTHGRRRGVDEHRRRLHHLAERRASVRQLDGRRRVGG